MDTTPFEAEARTRSRNLEETGRLPNGYTTRNHPLTVTELREGRRLRACLELATDADTFCALVRGEPVPARRLNPVYIDAHRRRNGHNADARETP